MVPPVVAMCMPYRYLSIKSFEQMLKFNGSLNLDFSGI